MRVAWHQHRRPESRLGRKCKCRWVDYFIAREGDFVDEDWCCGHCMVGALWLD